MGKVHQEKYYLDEHCPSRKTIYNFGFKIKSWARSIKKRYLDGHCQEARNSNPR